MSKIKKFLQQQLKLPLLEWILLLSVPLIIFKFKHKRGILIPEWQLHEIFYIGLSLVFLHLLYTLLLSFFRKSGKWVLLFNLLLVTIYYWLYVFHYRTQWPLDPGIIIENWNIGTDADSLKLIVDTFKLKDFNKFIGILVFIFVANYKWKIFEKGIETTFSLLKKIGIFCSLIVLLHFTPSFYDEFGMLFQQIYRYVIPHKSIIPVFTEQEYQSFKMLKTIKHKQDVSGKPHIFILMIESFNANFVLQKNERGKEYTPFFNSLISQGIFFNNFYGNSIQTAKGQFATLCSAIPLMRGKAFQLRVNLPFRCLPDLLSENGYLTIFTQVQSDLSFDNTKQFVLKNGYKYAISMDDSFITKLEKKKFYWGWGIQDNIYFKKVFKFLDKIHRKQELPLFVTLATISSHRNFHYTPKNQRYMYKIENSIKKSYANTIRATDEYLKEFFVQLKARNYLKNSIIFILGDHSFPIGEHGSYDSQNGYQNEYFKTPLLILGTGIKPHKVDRVRSQVDIAPTILSWVGEDTLMHSVGNNLFDTEPHRAYLVQPYAGKYLSVVDKNNMKYVYHVFTQQEFLFDLTRDPDENRNIISDKQRDYYRGLLKEIYMNERFILEN